MQAGPISFCKLVYGAGCAIIRWTASLMARQPHAASPSMRMPSPPCSCTGVAVFLLRNVEPKSWKCLHGVAATFWPNITVRIDSKCVYRISSKSGMLGVYPTTTAPISWVDHNGAARQWRDVSYDVSFSVGSAVRALLAPVLAPRVHSKLRAMMTCTCIAPGGRTLQVGSPEHNALCLCTGWLLH